MEKSRDFWSQKMNGGEHNVLSNDDTDVCREQRDKPVQRRRIDTGATFSVQIKVKVHVVKAYFSQKVARKKANSKNNKLNCTAVGNFRVVKAHRPKLLPCENKHVSNCDI